MGDVGNLVGVCIFALGIALLIFGFNDTTGTAIRLASGNPAGGPEWLLVGGGVSVLAGLVLAYKSKS